ncbi:hypothetical protein QWT69_16005 [Sporosarcina oncorhynchi]|uniref:Spore coat protein D n=1 Tax=Sporosarcina oncorhynchi TaxID=3056444 RepID=A0ABZ0L5E8_9BACL|nr:hypothetical protein [Sporosarcina sp. T2O-4]WOV87333.1 hypothetical protein QWT69_16005 [Sporosarcina sp. T2O-4]
MMQQGQWNQNQMMPQGQWNPNQMMPASQMPQNSQMRPIVCPTQCRFNDTFFPVEQPYVHPIVNVNRQHPVITPRHYYTESTQNVMGAPIRPGMGPTGVGPAGMGPGMGPGTGWGPGMGPGMGGGGCCGRRR